MPYLHVPKEFASTRTRQKGVPREGIAAASDGFLSGLDHRTDRQPQRVNFADVAGEVDRHCVGGKKSGLSYAMRMESSK